MKGRANLQVHRAGRGTYAVVGLGHPDLIMVNAGFVVTPGHVPSELCVYCPGSKVLFAGDTIYEGMPPNTRFAGPAEKAEWVRQLRRLRELDIEVVVPGHGAICGKEEIDRNIALLGGDEQ
jgi:glyoxylase-like metal-dependent hydrolase (beta-lactamase superfamily II)